MSNPWEKYSGPWSKYQSAANTDAMTHTGSVGESEFGINTTAAQDRISRDVLSDMSGPQRFIAGMGMNLSRMGRYTGNKLGLVSDEAVNDAAATDIPLQNTPGGGAGNFTGGMVWTAPIGMGATSGISTLGKMGARIAANPIARGAIEGATQGAIQSPKGDTFQGAAMGGGLGALIPGGLATIKKVASGLDVTPEARSLLNRGIDLTPGQMNAKGVANQLESSWESVPVLGPMISGARKGAENQYKQALIMEAAAPGATLSANKDLSALLDDAYKSFTPAYDQAKGFPLVLQQGKPVIVRAGTNTPLGTAFDNAVKDKSVLASDSTRRMVKSYLDDQLTKPIKKSDDLLAMRSALRSKIRGIKGANQDELSMREILENAEHSVTQSLESQLPQDAMQTLKATDAQYGKYKIVENAVGKGGDKDFTTFQASKAVREATGNGEYARGGGRLRDLTSAGAETFIDKPETGARLASIALPIAAMTAKPMLAIPAALGTAGMALTKTGRNLASGSTPFQRGLQAQINRLPNYTGMLPDELSRNLARMLRSGTVQQLGIQPGTNSFATE